MHNFLKSLFPALFFVFIMWIIVEADLDKGNVLIRLAHDVPLGDKMGHFLLYGLLALLLNWALDFRRVNIRARSFLLGSVIVFSFAVVEEFTQLAFASRTFDLGDVMADVAGIYLLSQPRDFYQFIVNKLR